jgi:Family of unknown function (DUF6527)
VTSDIVLKHQFVEYIPDRLQPGMIYVSIPYATVAHTCICGCGNDVITPITPTDWQLTFDGESVSLYPSIGNWSFQCKSHYWITRNQVKSARRWSQKEIEAGRAEDRAAKKTYFEGVNASSEEKDIRVGKLKRNRGGNSTSQKAKPPSA